MDDSKLVPTPSSAARGQTDFTTAERHSLVPASQSNPPSHERSSSSGRVEVISKSLGDRGFSDEAARLITSSWTLGPINNTIQHGNSGVAGVHRGKLIPFNHL